MKEVAVLFEAHVTISIGGHNIIGVKYCNRVGKQVLDESVSVIDKQFGTNMFVFHVRLYE
jgi:hypothetical protein